MYIDIIFLSHHIDNCVYWHYVYLITQTIDTQWIHGIDVSTYVRIYVYVCMYTHM